MNHSEDWLVVGRFGRPHGIKGFITVHSFTEPRDNLLQYTDWHVHRGNQWQPLKILNLESNNKQIVALVDGYKDRDQVAALTNLEIGVSRDQLAPLKPGEYYWHDLVDMQVYNKSGQFFGKVVEIMPTGSNDVLVVQGEKRYLIPYLLDEFIKEINPEKGIITVDWDLDF